LPSMVESAISPQGDQVCRSVALIEPECIALSHPPSTVIHRFDDADGPHGYSFGCFRALELFTASESHSVLRSARSKIRPPEVVLPQVRRRKLGLDDYRRHGLVMCYERRSPIPEMNMWIETEWVPDCSKQPRLGTSLPARRTTRTWLEQLHRYEHLSGR